MNIINEIMSRNERDAIEVKTVDYINKYLVSHDIPFKALLPDPEHRKKFYKSNTNLMYIPLKSKETNNFLLKTGKTLLKLDLNDKKDTQKIIRDEKLHTDIQNVLNQHIQDWRFSNLRMDNLELRLIVGVVKR